MGSLFVKCIETITNLERQGRISEARRSVESCLENFADFSEDEQNELMLRKAAILYHDGDTEEARNLICKIKPYFSEKADNEKIAECENYLALCYLKAGELTEAKEYLKEAFSYPLKRTYQRLYSHIIKQMILLDEKRFNELVEVFGKYREIFKGADDTLRGHFLNNLAMAFNNLGETRTAIIYYLEAKEFFVKVENLFSEGTACNNLAFCYLKLKDYEAAKKYAFESINIFGEAESFARQASALDTFANIYLAENDFQNAQTLIDDSIEILKLHPNTLYLLESYKTKVAILHAMGKTPEAMPFYAEARNIALTYCGEDWTKLYDNAIAAILRGGSESPVSPDFPGKQEIARKKLVFPGGFGEWGEMARVEILSDALASFGLRKGMIAVVACCGVEEGDLAAILENGKASLGIYREEGGRKCLDIPGHESLCFGDGAKILGIVIGGGDPAGDAEAIEVFLI